MVMKALSQKFLPKARLQEFKGKLLELGELFAPVQEGDVAAIRRIESPGEIVDDFDQTQNNLRAVIEPQNEVILTFKDTLKPSLTEQLPAENKRIVLWCRPCDARALSPLDDNFDDALLPDPYYLRRRKSTTIIGLGCEKPFPFCFCGSVGGNPFSTDNLDVMMTRIKDGYIFEPLTKRGKDLEAQLASLFSEITVEQKDFLLEIQGKSRTLLPRTAPNPEMVHANLGKLFDSPLWKKWGDKCIGCGICTLLCPTCWCFDITDVETRGKGYRIRTWDSCQFPLFTLHTSGHNPRPTKASRVRQRVMHKYRYHPVNYSGRIACVGCGRCTELCPEDIDLIEILNDIMKAGEPQ